VSADGRWRSGRLGEAGGGVTPPLSVTGHCVPCCCFVCLLVAVSRCCCVVSLCRLFVCLLSLIDCCCCVAVCVCLAFVVLRSAFFVRPSSLVLRSLCRPWSSRKRCFAAAIVAIHLLSRFSSLLLVAVSSYLCRRKHFVFAFVSCSFLW